MTDRITPYAQEPFDPTCTHRTTFSKVRVDDQVDYWGVARPVIEHDVFDDGRTRILVTNEHGGRDVAVGPGGEPVWRRLRDGEYMQ